MGPRASLKTGQIFAGKLKKTYSKRERETFYWKGFGRLLFFFFQGIGDIQLAYQCFRLALASNNDHAEAYNNLGVLEMRKGHTEQV